MQPELLECEFVAIYQPVANHLNPHASFAWGLGYGTLFETFGGELDYVRSQPIGHVWTLVSGDGDAILSGFHFVNRVGYFICRSPVPPDILLSVRLSFDG